MTYSSSAERISCGFGRPLVCGLAWTSSRMMSLHRSTHSSQMYTEGPAMSLRTSCSLLPQKEQYRTRPLWAVGVLPRVSLVISHPHPVVDARRLLYSTGSFFCKIGFLSRSSAARSGG